MKNNKILFWMLALTAVLIMAPEAHVIAEEAQKPQNVLEKTTAAVTDTLALAPLQTQDKIKVKEFTIKTDDGWTLAINRYNAESVATPKAAVILCHGFNLNNLFWDLDPRSSLARYLANNGYDVWVPSLRGSGRSSKPTLSRIRSIAKFEFRNVPNMLIRAPFDITKFGWTIDDHIEHDAPAIVDFVRKTSGFGKVYWIGHSMGGIIMYGYLETMGQNDIAGFIPIGSMMIMPTPLTPHLKSIANQKPLMTASLIVNTTVASQLRNITFGAVKHPIEGMLMERANMYDEVVTRFFRLGVDDASAGVVSQFSDSIRKGGISSFDGSYSYTDGLAKITVPTMMLYGAKDAFVTPDSMQACYDKLSSRDKTIVRFSTTSNYSADYGHCDLVIGKGSQQEVYPVILDWLDKRATASAL